MLKHGYTGYGIAVMSLTTELMATKSAAIATLRSVLEQRDNGQHRPQ
jgi:hypothetical protein